MPSTGGTVRRPPHLGREKAMNPRVLTALPVYNEAAHVPDVLREVRRFADDVLVVDDGSTDGTHERLADFPDVAVVRHEPNRGYGAAVRTAFEYAVEHGYDALVTIDCDGQHEPRLIPQLAARLFDPDREPADIVSGSRYLAILDDDGVPPEDRRRINAEVTGFLNERLGLDLTDSFCGFKAYRVAALPRLHVTEFGYAMPLQLWVQAVDAGLRIVEYPVPLIYLDEERSFGGSLDDARERLRYYREVLERELTASHCCADER
jgi:glycosyltransferase involved in cell wall biosynthesis